ncbi:MAG: methyltransferase domain-containing protein [Clostridiaceae bacterium]
MKSKIAQLLTQSATFRCPICHGDLHPLVGSLVCPNDHTFDLSKKGSVNFVPSQKPLKYTKELFDARGRIFAAGFYLPLVKAIEDVVKNNSRNGTLNSAKGALRITDAGCGQGYYAKLLAQNPTQIVTGFDLSADAISLASAGAHQALFMVADVTNIPLQDHSQDIILDILTQANYHEFQRILKTDGLVIKVMPAPHYLKEIRQLLSGQLRQDIYNDQPVIDHFFANHINGTLQTIEYTLPLSHPFAKDFLLMTPLSLHIDQSLIDLMDLTEITIALNILTGQYPVTADPVRE